MNRLLIDVDSKIDNQYLMQLSTYYKLQGDEVYLGSCPEPDTVDISVIFDWNVPKARGIAKMFTCPVRIGGSGVLKSGDPYISQLKPDYDLYTSTMAQGRLTFGCPHTCEWCVVPKMEGKPQIWQHIEDFWDDRFDMVHLLDSNVLSIPDWFMKNTDWILERKIRIKENGMDIRFLTEPIVKRLRELDFDGMLHFAWDHPSYEDSVLESIKLLKDTGFDTRSEISIYVLTNYNTTKEQDIHRVRKLRDLDVNPFVMVYGNGSKWHRTFQRCVNRKHIFWSDSWSDGLEV